MNSGIFIKNCCDGAYNSMDIHFTSACDNKCAHCIDLKYAGLNIQKPDVNAIVKTIVDNQYGYDDVLFLGGEPCLYLEELVDTVTRIKYNTDLKIYVTTAIPKICHDQKDLFIELLQKIDGINLSVQHYDENIADRIRRVKSKYDRQSFYNSLPFKEKIRINLNIVKPFLYTRKDITECLLHYDKMGFNEIKLSEIQHGNDFFVSFEKVFGIKMKSPFSGGCQTILNTENIIPEMVTPLLLKRSCFMCEDTLKASVMDGVKSLYQFIAPKVENNYAVIYENGSLARGWK